MRYDPVIVALHQGVFGVFCNCVSSEMSRLLHVEVVGSIWRIEAFVSPLPILAFLRSENIPSSGKEHSIDVVPRIHGGEATPIRPIKPEILRRATVKIDFYLHLSLSLACFVGSLFYLTIVYCSSLPLQDILSFSVSTAITHLSPVNNQTVAQPRINRMSPLFNLFALLTK